MGYEVNLLRYYPRAVRDVVGRLESKTEESREIARRFDREFFDGDRDTGYGGLNYNPKYWESVVSDLSQYYKLTPGSKVLDIGCAKGFMLYDFERLFPANQYYGLDISEYAIKSAKVFGNTQLMVGDARNLPYPDDYFDLVICINTLHNFDGKDIERGFSELNRVSKDPSRCFVVVDAYRSEAEKEAMFAWNLTAKTILSESEWLNFFEKVGYKGDYFWFKP